MPIYGSTEIIRARAREDYFEPARNAGQTHVTIRSGDFNKSLVSRRLIPANRLPLICNALKSSKLLKENRVVLEQVEGPESGLSSTVLYTYRLEPGPQVSPSPSSPPTGGGFSGLGGVLRETYRKLGGSDAFHAAERAEWGK